MESLKKNKKHYENSLEYRVKLNIIAGGLTGFITDIICYPLETIKTRLQITSKYRVNSTIHNIYNGLNAQLIMTIPATIIYFVTYESTKYFFDQVTPSDSVISLPVKTFAGAFLGEIMAGIVANPLEIIKQKIQVGQFKKISEGIRKIRHNRGFLGFYTGFLSLLIREIPFSCFQFPIYEVLLEMQ